MVTPVDVATVEVLPDSVRITEGDTVRLSAVPRDAAGNKLVGRTVTWSARDPAVVEVDQTGLVRGLRAGTSDVAADLDGLTASALVAVDARPVIALERASVAFSAVVGADPLQQSIAVTNAAGGSLHGLDISVDYGSGPDGWLEATLSGTTAPAALTLVAAPRGLRAGSYSAEVAVSAVVAANSPQTVAVTLEVREPAAEARIALDPDAVTFEAVSGEADPSPRTVSVTNGGGGTLSGLSVSVSYGSGASGWLEATLGSIAAPATLTLRARTGSLADGTYTATVSVTASAAANSPRTVAVTFEVAGIEAPTNLTVTNESAVAIDLAWNHAGTGVATFRLERRVGASYSGLAEIPGSAREYRDGNVAKATTYHYRLRACSAAGICSEYSNEATGRTKGN